jgi:glycosyltransferase involved in cell wall biosynthesis
VDHAEETLAVGLVSNLDRPVKRIDLFLRAAALAAPAHPELTWHVIGTGARLDDYRRMAAGLELSDRVVFPGAVRDIGGYLGRLAIGVICSDSEGFSNALLEYMLRGCAAVATAVGGNREAIRHGETGLLVPAGDAAALAAAISSLAANSGERRRLARRAREEAAANYGWGRCVEAHHELYARLLAQRAAVRGREGPSRAGPAADGGGAP